MNSLACTLPRSDESDISLSISSDSLQLQLQLGIPILALAYAFMFVRHSASLLSKDAMLSASRNKILNITIADNFHANVKEIKLRSLRFTMSKSF